MTATDLMASLRRCGVELWADGDQVRYSAPAGVLTEALRTELVARKAEILALLGDRSGVRGPVQSPRSDGRPDALHLDPAGLDHAPDYTKYVNPYLGSLLAQADLDKEYVRGQGCYLYDQKGRRYLDFIAQYGAVPFGYNPPEIWKALEDVRWEQSPSFVQPSLLATAGRLAERLIRVAPPGLRYVTFTNSGAEAVEVALKLCRSVTGRPGILAVQNSFHGKTLGALSATGRRMYQAAFGAPVEGFDHIPFGDIAALRRVLGERPGHYAAFIVEPILGEGGIVELPPGYLAEARGICDRAGTLLVVDEVQTGLGRTGHLFACEHDRVAPDVLTLAKALGGGLIPIGACLCRAEVYNAEFALRHSSTFAGNALACRAGLATLDLLERDGRALIRRVAEYGSALKQELLRLRANYPSIVKDVRGRGYMLALQFDLSSASCRRGLLGYLTEQQLFGSVVTSYLLNVEHVRLASPMSATDVLRIEPPLVAGWSECGRFIEALDRTLRVVESGNTARLVGHLVGADVDARAFPVTTGASTPSRHAEVPVLATHEAVGRFAFVFHLNELRDCIALDPSLEALTETQLADLKKRGLGLLTPSSFSEVVVESRTGQKASGQCILVPYTPQELTEMPWERALSSIQHAIDLAQAAGAQVVGLGGFISIVTQGGLALREDRRPALTTGNSYTVATGKRAVEMACRKRGRTLSCTHVAVVGAAGAIGRMTAMLLAEDAARLILLGNPKHPDRSRARLLEVAGQVAHHLWRSHREEHRSPADGSLAACILSMASSIPVSAAPAQWVEAAKEIAERHGLIEISTDAQALRDADVVVTATSAVDSFINPEHLREGAIVCELSRPFNVSPEARALRPDILWLEGGLVRLPGDPDLGLNLWRERGVAFACMAETMVLALERRYRDTGLGGDLQVETVRELDALAEKHGFVVTY